MLLITCDIDSRSVRSWCDRPIAYVAASPVEFMLPPAFLGFKHFRPRTVVPRTAVTARDSRRTNIKQMKCEQWRSSIRRGQLVDQVSSRMKTFLAHIKWRINVLWGPGQFKFTGNGIYGNEHFAFLSPFNFEQQSKVARFKNSSKLKHCLEICILKFKLHRKLS